MEEIIDTSDFAELGEHLYEGVPNKMQSCGPVESQ